MSSDATDAPEVAVEGVKGVKGVETASSFLPGTADATPSSGTVETDSLFPEGTRISRDAVASEAPTGSA